MNALPDVNVSSKERSAEFHGPVELILDESGIIKACIDCCEEYFGYNLKELVKNHISKLLPQFSGFELIQRGTLNQKLDYLCHCGHQFQVQLHQGGDFSSELSLVCLEHAGKRFIKLFVLSNFNSMS